MKNIEKVIELVAFTETQVSALLDCNDEFKSILFRLNVLKDNEALNARFEGLDETEIEQKKAGERAEEIKALQEEAAEAFRVRKVSQLVFEKFVMEVETTNPLNYSTVEPTEPVVVDEVEPIKPAEPVVEKEVEPTEPNLNNEVEAFETKVDDEVVKIETVVEQLAPQKTTKKVK